MLRVSQLIGFGIGSGEFMPGRVLARSGSYALVGNAAGLVRVSPTNKVLAAGAGSYGLTGTAASLVSGFTPTSLSGLIGWWDTSVFGSLTITGGTDISAMADQSTAGNTMSAFTQSPAYSATGLNSRPAMLLTSGTKALHKTSLSLGTGNTLTVFCVATLDSAGTGAYGRLLSYKAATGSNDADNNGSFLLGRDNANNGMVLYRNGSTATKAMAANATFRCIATINSSGVMTIYIDGVSATGSTLNAAFVSGGELAIACQAVAWNSGWRSAISEVGIATGFTNSTDAAKLDIYLKNKWGL
jgi:hypothetical protein